MTTTSNAKPAGPTIPATGTTVPEAQPAQTAPQSAGEAGKTEPAKSGDQRAKLTKLGPSDGTDWYNKPGAVEHVYEYKHSCKCCGYRPILRATRCAHVTTAINATVYYTPAAAMFVSNTNNTLEQVMAEEPPAKRRKLDPLVGVEPNPGPPGGKGGAHGYPSFKFHGNYGGPGYSSGKFTDTPDWAVPATDEVDEVFKKHDHDYGTMTHQQADALAVTRLKKISPSVSTRYAKAQIAALGFHVKSLAAEGPPDRVSYPWDDKLRPTRVREGKRRQSTPNPAPALQEGGRPLSAADDPVTLTSAGMAIHPNPGPPKSHKGKRSRSASRKGTRKRSTSRKRARSAPRSNKGRKSSSKRGHGPQAGPGSRGKGASVSAGQRAQNQPFRRTDLLFSGTVNGSSAPGTVLYSAAVNPSGKAVGLSNSIIAEYLNYEAAKWEQFDCTVEFTVKATGAMTVSGTFTHGVDSDVTDVLPGGTIAAVQRLTGQGGHTSTFAKGGSVGYNKLNSSKSQSKYWVQPANDSDSRSVAKGKYWLILNDPTASYFSTGAGQAVDIRFQVFVTYTFRFFNATLELPNSLAGTDSGLVLNQAAGGTATDPLNFAALSTAVIDPSTVPSAQNDIWLTNNGIDDYIVFGVGANDNTNYVAIVVGCSGTSPALTSATPGGGATLVSASELYAGTVAEVVYSFVVGLASTSAPVAFSGAWKKVTGGFQQQLGTVPIRNYGYISFHGTGVFANSTLQITTYQNYIPTGTDRMFLSAGPGTIEHKHTMDWDYMGPLEAHVERKLAADRSRASDIKLLVGESRKLEAEHRLDLEYMGLSPTPPQNSPEHRSERIESKEDSTPLKSAIRKRL